MPEFHETLVERLTVVSHDAAEKAFNSMHKDYEPKPFAKIPGSWKLVAEESVKAVLAALSETHLILPKPVVGEGERDALQDLERCEKATPPPWSVMQRGCHELGYDVEGAEAGIRGQFEREEDAEFCAESRTSEPYWIKRCLLAEALLKGGAERG